MAKSNSKKPNASATAHSNEESNSKPNAAQPQPPAGYRKQAQDVAGYWDPEGGPIHFVPRSVKMFDSNLESNKPSILIVGELIDAAPVNVKDDDSGEMAQTTAQAGEAIGVWYKPGMRALVNLCDAKVWMYQSGERKTGKPNPMKLFSVSSPGPNKKFGIVIDEREQSAGASTDFGGPRAGGPARRGRGGANAGYTRDPDADNMSDPSGEDIPF